MAFDLLSIVQPDSVRNIHIVGFPMKMRFYFQLIMRFPTYEEMNSIYVILFTTRERLHWRSQVGYGGRAPPLIRLYFMFKICVHVKLDISNYLNERWRYMSAVRPQFKLNLS